MALLSLSSSSAAASYQIINRLAGWWLARCHPPLACTELGAPGQIRYGAWVPVTGATPKRMGPQRAVACLDMDIEVGISAR